MAGQEPRSRMSTVPKVVVVVVLLACILLLFWHWSNNGLGSQTLRFIPSMGGSDTRSTLLASNSNISVAASAIEDLLVRHPEVLSGKQQGQILQGWAAIKSAIGVDLNGTSEHVEPTWKRYAVIGCKIPGGNQDTYSFYLPLTARAWKRLGYGTLVILAGDTDKWKTNPTHQYMEAELLRLGAILVRISADKDREVMLSQVSRLFAALLVDWSGREDTFLLTSDADLWPLNQDLYEIQPAKDILILNSECCGNFQHKGTSYKMFPLSSIGMSVRLWREVMKVNSSAIKTPKDVIEYFRQEVGGLALKPVHKGMNDGWFMDQHVASIRLEQWAKTHNRTRIQYVKRNVRQDRIDRSGWNVPADLKGKNDSHLLLNGHTDSSWKGLLPLLRLMYSEEEVQQCQEYRDHFVQLISV